MTLANDKTKRAFINQLTCRTFAKGFVLDDPNHLMKASIRESGGKTYCGRIVQRLDDKTYELHDHKGKLIKESKTFQEAREYFMVDEHDRIVKDAMARRVKKLNRKDHKKDTEREL